MGHSLIGRPLYGSCEEEASFADARLGSRALCLLESLCVRHDVFGALPALESNDPYEKVVVCRSELSEGLLTESPSHTPSTVGFPSPRSPAGAPVE